MPRKVARANCFDASALVKLHVNEEGSDIMRGYFHNRAPGGYTTPFCFYEALNVLKSKWLIRGEITRDEYFGSAKNLVTWFAAISRRTPDIDFTNSSVFRDVQAVADRNSLDLSDAFQIVSVKSGYFSPLAGESRTILVTADEGLAKAARKESIRAWHVLGEPEP